MGIEAPARGRRPVGNAEYISASGRGRNTLHIYCRKISASQTITLPTTLRARSANLTGTSVTGASGRAARYAASLALRVAHLGAHRAMRGPLGTAPIRIRNTQHLPLYPILSCCVRDHARYLRTPKPTVRGLTQVRHFASTMPRHAMLRPHLPLHQMGRRWCAVRRTLDPYVTKCGAGRCRCGSGHGRPRRASDHPPMAVAAASRARPACCD